LKYGTSRRVLLFLFLLNDKERTMATNTDDIKNTMNKDIAALQQEVARLQKLVSAQGTEAYYELRDRAGKVYEDAAPRAKRAVAQIRAEGAAVSDVVREHPTATTTALALVGAIGFLAGYLLAGSAQPEPRQWWQR
jgi:ElaB/YqjD/DUF883 family membrane-anchored ribosome-binding protein